MKQCPTCKGIGTQNIQSSTYKDGDFVLNDPVTIECITCNGKGCITNDKFIELEQQRHQQFFGMMILIRNVPNTIGDVRIAVKSYKQAKWENKYVYDI